MDYCIPVSASPARAKVPTSRRADQLLLSGVVY
jgi:hypothetical protein